MKISPPTLSFVTCAVAGFVFGCGGGTTTSSSNVPVAPLASPAPAQKYVVRLHRDSHVGDKTRDVVDDDKQELVVSRLLGVPPNKSDKKTHTRLVGTMVVQELDEKHDVRRTEVAIAELWQTVDGGARAVLVPPGGRIVIVRAAEKNDAQILVNGQPASKELRDALDDVLTLTTGGPSDDEIFGTAVPQAVGAEWLPDVQLAEKDLADKGMMVRPGGLSGKVKLLGTQQVNGALCLDVEAGMEIDGILSINDLPPGSSIQSGHMSARMRGLFPTEDKLGKMGEEMDITMRVKMRVPSPNGDVEVDVKTVDHRSATYVSL